MNSPQRNDDTYRVSIEVTDEGKLDLPISLVERLQPGALVHITVATNELSADIDSREWADLTAQQFLLGYSHADSIYDTLDD